MTLAVAESGRAVRKRRSARPVDALNRGSGIALGLALTWFSLLVLIPLAAVVAQAAAGGWDGVTNVLSNAQNLHAIEITVRQALLVTGLNIVMGTAIAWVLVRDRFPGAAILDVIIDIPFALPTIVTGLVLVTLYGPKSPLNLDIANSQKAVFLAMAFVTLPFVVRTVQPVLEELEADVEEAASSLGASRFTTFRRVILPSLVPAIAAGAALSFARGIGEYGSMVLLTGNLPGQTEVVSVRVISYIEGGNTAAASVLATVMLLIALVVIVGFDLVQRRVARRD